MDNKLHEIERRANAIGYDLYEDEGYCEIVDLLNEAEEEERELTDEEMDYIEDELMRLDGVVFGKVRK